MEHYITYGHTDMRIRWQMGLSKRTGSVKHHRSHYSCLERVDLAPYNLAPWSTPKMARDSWSQGVISRKKNPGVPPVPRPRAPAP